MKFLPEINAYLYENNSLWHKISPKLLNRNFFLWQDISSFDNSCGKKNLLVARNFLLWQEISSCGKKFLPVARHLFLWKIFVSDIIFCMKIILLFPKESSFYDTRKGLLTTEKHWLGRNFLHHLAGNTFVSSLWQKRVNFCQHFVWAWRFRGSLAPWLPGNIPPW